MCEARTRLDFESAERAITPITATAGGGSDTRPARLAQPRRDDMPMTRCLLTKDAAYNVRAVKASWYKLPIHGNTQGSKYSCLFGMGASLPELWTEYR